MYYFQEIQDRKKGNSSKSSGLTKEGREQIETILTQLNKLHGYSQEGAINCLKYLIKKRYDVKH